MAILSSHILNSINGHHASKVDVFIFQINTKNERRLFFKTFTDDGGRILKEFNLSNDDCLCVYEMVIKTGDYFIKEYKNIFKKRIVSEIVVKFKMEDPKKMYHIPIIISPNSYSIWWSE